MTYRERLPWEDFSSRRATHVGNTLGENRRTIMKGIPMLCLARLGLSATAEDQQRVYQTDTHGRTQHNKPSYSVGEDGRIVEVDPSGNKQYHRQQYLLKDGRVYAPTSPGKSSATR
jgi:hypothetical protein